MSTPKRNQATRNNLDKISINLQMKSKIYDFLPKFENRTQLFGSDGKEMTEKQIENFKFTSEKLLGSGAQGSIYLVNVTSDGS